MPETPKNKPEIKTFEELESYIQKLTDEKTKRTYEEHKNHVQGLINNGVKKRTAAHINLITDFIGLSKKASEGQQISAEDFNAVVKKYNKESDPTLGDYLLYIWTAGVSDEEGKRLLDAAKTMEEKALKKGKKEIDEWKENHDEIFGIPTNLNNAFIRQYLSKEPKKNLTLPDGIDNPEKLISALLKNNPGFAVGDIHRRDAVLNFLSENMGNLKKSGVDTVYIESESFYNELMKGSGSYVKELKTAIKESEPKSNTKPGISFSDRNWYAGRTDDMHLALLKLLLAAKENGVDIVNIDIEGDARKITPARVATTNFTWTEALNDYRRLSVGSSSV